MPLPRTFLRVPLTALALLVLAPAGASGSDLAAADLPEIWQRLTIPEREGHTLVYDSSRDRLIAFGGFDGAHYLGDVWVFESSPAPHWVPLDVPPSPPPRAGHGAVYDPDGDRLIVFGGHDASYTFADMWSLSLGGTPAWTALGTPFPSPLMQAGFAAIHDPVGQRIVLFGGFGGSYDDRVWTVPLAGPWTWTPHAIPGAPRGRDGHSAVYDPVRRGMVVFGGHAVDTFGNDEYLADAWTLSLDTMTWQEIGASGSPPSERAEHIAAYDPYADRMLVFGGHGTFPADEVFPWGLSLATPQQWIYLAVTDICPPARPRVRAASCVDPVASRWVMFGGTADLGGTGADTWFMDLVPGLPWFLPLALQPLAYSAGFFDTRRERLLLHGGLDPINSVETTWGVTGLNYAVLEALPSNGPYPGGHSIVYDTRRDRAIVFGGAASAGFCSLFPTVDVHTLSLDGSPAWTALSPAGTPPAARLQHAAVYDPVGDRMIVFGGTGNPFVPDPLLNDTWALEFTGGPHWVELHPSGFPPNPCMGHAAVYDPAGHRMLVFGGTGVSGLPLDGVWALDLTGDGAWSLLAPAGTPPAARAGHSLALDTRRQRLLLFGGTAFGMSAEVWALSLAPLAWTQIVPPLDGPAPRAGQVAAYDSTLDRLLVYGGVDETGRLHNDLWSLRLGAVVGVPAPAGGPRVASLGGATPNPTRSGARFVLDLPRAAPVDATIHDLTGRLVGRVAAGDFSAGRHALQWDGAAADGAPAGPGVYFLGVRVDGAFLSRRILVVR